MSKGAFIGTFDPITLGHFDIITRASKIFDKVCVVLMHNEAKYPTVSVEDRLLLINKCVKEIKNVEVYSHTGLAVDYCKKNKIDCLIRGIRSPLDTDYELSMAWANMDIGNIDTIVLPVSNKYLFISSTLVRELTSNDGDISSVVPSQILNDIKRLYSREGK